MSLSDSKEDIKEEKFVPAVQPTVSSETHQTYIQQEEIYIKEEPVDEPEQILEPGEIPRFLPCIVKIEKEDAKSELDLKLPRIDQVFSLKNENPYTIWSKSTFTGFALKLGQKSSLDYLPDGILIPSNLQMLQHPIHVKVDQPDGSTVYINQKSQKSVLFISNFNLHSNHCELCGQDFAHGVYNTFVQHRSNFHFFPGDRHECVCCAKSFDSSDQKQRHSLFCTEKSKLDVSLCYICNIKFDDFFNYRQHLMASHPKITNSGKTEAKMCQICKKSVTYETMTDHLLRHEDPKPYKCAECGSGFGIKRNLKRHLMEIHFQQLCPYKCDECPLYFTMLSHLLKHRNRVHNKVKTEKRQERPKEICQKCGKLTGDMKNHMKRHSELEAIFVTSKGHKCETCEKIYATVAGLRNHKKTHLPESERPHKCAYCTKGFNSKQLCVEHERSHTGEKPHVCPECEKAFARFDAYKDHVKTHNGEGHKCDHCDYLTPNHSSFRKHLKKHEKQLGIKLTYTKEERRWKDMGVYDKAKYFI
ncbi:zinc finger protein 184-like [Culicoides brevitarsis]|uniref:zinc finger protein 184-like n=1 Tax=Culicoides brevitarsis TaxID=469753 RepID=UPI00307BE026